MLQMRSAEDLANYLNHFRADNIVNDAEFIRKYLVPDAGTWTVLGQVLRLLFWLLGILKFELQKVMPVCMCYNSALADRSYR